MQNLTREFIYVDDIKESPCDMLNLNIVGSYSVNGKREYSNDLSQLKYYKERSNVKNVHLDLDKNDDTIYKPDDITWEVNFMFKWISENLDRLKTKNSTKLIDADFICYRGVLKKLLFTPFEKYNDWIICAAKFKGTIYLYSFDTDKRKHSVLNETPGMKRSAAWGSKFEQYMLSDTPFKNPDLSVPHNQNEEFCCIYKSNFGNKTLLYGAEMDGLRSKDVVKDTIIGKDVEFIELKTVHPNFFSNGRIKNYTKTLMWWAQSYWANVNTIVCGIKGDNGIVKEIQEVDLRNLECHKKDQREKCQGFCSGFLQYVQNVVRKEHDECVYKFTFDPNGIPKKIIVEEMKFDPNSEYSFLQSWYVNKVEDFAKQSV